MDLVHELCPLQLLEVTKKSDTWAYTTVYNILVYEQIHEGNINFQFRDGTVWDMTEDCLIMR